MGWRAIESTDPLGRRQGVLRSSAESSSARKEDRMIFVGNDWSEGHHDVCVMD